MGRPTGEEQTTMPVDILSQNALVTGSLALALTTGILPASASTTSGNAVDLGAGGALPAGSPRFMVTRINLTSAQETSGGGTVIFTMDHSSDNSNWLTLAGTSRGFNDIITLTASVQTAELFIFWRTIQRYVRLTVTVGTTPVGANLQFTAGFEPCMP
jgi:hypothetical protein